MSPAEKKVDHFDARAIHTLQEVTHALGSPGKIKAGLNRTLEILSRHHLAARTAILLRRDGTSELRIEACRGLTPEEQKAFLRVEDGIIDRVLESGKSVVVPKANADSLFLRQDGTHSINHANGRTFFCV